MPYSGSSNYTSGRMYTGSSSNVKYGLDDSSTSNIGTNTKDSSRFLSGNTAHLLKAFSKNSDENTTDGKRPRGTFVSQYSNFFENKANNSNRFQRPREIDTKTIDVKTKPTRAFKTEETSNTSSIRRDREVVRLTTKREEKYEDLFAVKDKTIKSIAQRLLEKYTISEPKPVDPLEYVPKNRKLATNSIDVENSIHVSISPVSSTISSKSPSVTSQNETHVTTVIGSSTFSLEKSFLPDNKNIHLDMSEESSSDESIQNEDDCAVILQRATEAAITKKEFESVDEVKDAIVAAVLLPDVDIESDEEMKQLINTDSENSAPSSRSSKQQNLLKVNEASLKDSSVTQSDVLVDKLKRFVKDHASIKKSSRQNSKRKNSCIISVTTEKLITDTDFPITTSNNFDMADRTTDKNESVDLSKNKSIEESEQSVMPNSDMNKDNCIELQNTDSKFTSQLNSSEKSENNFEATGSIISQASSTKNSLKKSRSLSKKLSSNKRKSKSSENTNTKNSAKSRKNSLITPEYNLITGLKTTVEVSSLLSPDKVDPDSDVTPAVSLVISQHTEVVPTDNQTNKVPSESEVSSPVIAVDYSKNEENVFNKEKESTLELTEKNSEESNHSKVDEKDAEKMDKSLCVDSKPPESTNQNEGKSDHGVPNYLLKPGFEEKPVKKVWKKPVPPPLKKEKIPPPKNEIIQLRNVLKKPVRPAKDEIKKEALVEEIKVKKVWKKPGQLPLKTNENVPTDPSNSEKETRDVVDNVEESEKLNKNQHSKSLNISKSADSAYSSSPSTPQSGGVTSEPITETKLEVEEGEVKKCNNENEEILKGEEVSEKCDICGTNCHKKCEKQMPNLCGVNQKLLAEALSSVKKSNSVEKEVYRTLNPSLVLKHSSSSVSSTDTDATTTEDDETDTDSEFNGPAEIRSPLQFKPKFKKYNVDDFIFVKVLGKGSFGKVMLAQQVGTENYFAVKCLKKDVVLEDNDVECCLIERKVLTLGTKHPYLCHLFCSFQTPSHLFFVMEYLTGGDLMFHIQHVGRFDEFRACFYAAEIASGLRFLHNKGIIYRDLKLDNILLDYEGHIRIADFGMCKLQIYLDKFADTFCGTPDYMAPEVIKGQHYNQCVDWWSFGVLLYEMMVGKSPFKGCDEDHLFWLICNEEPFYPKFLSKEAQSILKQLLDKDSTKRLGILYSPYGDLRGHAFFKYIDWDKIEAKKVETPYKPKLRHILDVQYFDRLFTKRNAALTPLDESILNSMDQTPFNEFSYTNPNITD